MDEKRLDIPTTEQFEKELKRLRYRQNFVKTLWNTISSLIVVAAIAIIISTMLLPVLRVTGTSMTPTLQNDEVLLCSKLGNYESGDIIAFYYNNKILLKRVIATNGMVVDISEDGSVTGLYVYTLENGVSETGPYTPVYTNNGTNTDGAVIEVNNAQGMAVKKLWLDSSGREISAPMQNNTPMSIGFEVYGVDSNNIKHKLELDVTKLTFPDYKYIIPQDKIGNYPNYEVKEILSKRKIKCVPDSKKSRRIIRREIRIHSRAEE